MNDKKEILTKLHAIMSEVGVIGKDKRNDFHKYNYASEYAIKLAIQKLLIEHKVMFITSISEVENTVMETKGSVLTTIKMTYRFYDIETGQDISGCFNGSGEDKADKGLYKAITGAIKYILTSVFLIPTGDDPEKVDPKATGETTTPAPPSTTKKEYPPDDRDWLSEEIFNSLLKGANEGKGLDVEKEMAKYKMKKTYRTTLEMAIKNYSK